MTQHRIDRAGGEPRLLAGMTPAWESATMLAPEAIPTARENNDTWRKYEDGSAALCDRAFHRGPRRRGAGGRDAEAGRRTDVQDPGRRAAELRRASRGDLCHDPFGGTVLQRPDPARSERPVGDRAAGVRSVYQDADPDRWR